MSVERVLLLQLLPRPAEAALLPWLRQQAARGYCLVGLEQTAESTKLQVRCPPG